MKEVLMLQVRVDGEPFAGTGTAGTFDDVLGVIEPSVATRSRIVTAIRINGVDEPAFREPSVRSRTLQRDDHVDIDTTSARQLATDALADTVRLMPALCAAATQTAGLLRTADAPEAARELAPLAEGLTLLVTLVQAAEAWADAARIAHASWLGADVATVAACIDGLEAAQRDADWVSAADVLAYDLGPALDAWRARLEEASGALSAPGPEADAAKG